MRFLPSLLVAALVALTPASAALASPTDEVELTRKVIETERQAIVAANMGLTDAQAAVFWPIYNQYQTDIRKVSDQYLSIIQRYAASYPQGPDDATADQLMRDWLAMENDGIKIRRRYVKAFGKVLPAPLVLRFFQIENKLTTVIRADLALQIPLTEG